MIHYVCSLNNNHTPVNISQGYNTNFCEGFQEIVLDWSLSSVKQYIGEENNNRRQKVYVYTLCTAYPHCIYRVYTLYHPCTHIVPSVQVHCTYHVRTVHIEPSVYACTHIEPTVYAHLVRILNCVPEDKVLFHHSLYRDLSALESFCTVSNIYLQYIFTQFSFYISSIKLLFFLLKS